MDEEVADPDWVDVPDAATLGGVLGVQLESSWQLLRTTIPQLPDADRWWVTPPVWDFTPAFDASSLGLQVFNLGHGFDPVHFSVSGARKTFGDLGVLALDYLLGRTPSPTAVVRTVVKLLRNLATLDEDEAEAVAVIASAIGGNPYRGDVAEASLRESYAEATVDLDALLAALERKQVVSRDGGRVRLVV